MWVKRECTRIEMGFPHEKFVPVNIVQEIEDSEKRSLSHAYEN
jgi:hypothetical protein